MECLALQDDFVSTAYGTPVDRTHYKFTDPIIFLKKFPDWSLGTKSETCHIQQCLWNYFYFTNYVSLFPPARNFKAFAEKHV